MMDNHLSKINFESKSELLKRLRIDHDQDCSLVVFSDKTLQFVDAASKELLFEADFSESILKCVFADRCRRVKSKRTLMVLAINSCGDLEKLRIELIDFYFSETDLVIHASEINPNFVKGGKEKFYGDDLYLRLTNVTSIGFTAK